MYNVALISFIYYYTLLSQKCQANFQKEHANPPHETFFEKTEKIFLKKLKFLENAPIYISEARENQFPEGKMPEKTLEACDVRRTNRVAIGKKTETTGKIIN